MSENETVTAETTMPKRKHVEREEFVNAYARCSSVNELSAMLNLQPASISARVKSLTAKGFKFPRYARANRVVSQEEIDRLNAVLAGGTQSPTAG